MGNRLGKPATVEDAESIGSTISAYDGEDDSEILGPFIAPEPQRFDGAPQMLRNRRSEDSYESLKSFISVMSLESLNFETQSNVQTEIPPVESESGQMPHESDAALNVDDTPLADNTFEGEDNDDTLFDMALAHESQSETPVIVADPIEVIPLQPSSRRPSRRPSRRRSRQPSRRSRQRSRQPSRRTRQSSNTIGGAEAFADDIAYAAPPQPQRNRRVTNARARLKYAVRHRRELSEEE